ncbi:type II toxin-antitoxin system toxin DNA ADP-ribosyl transferase DarT [Luedemannella helvata]|uniref:Toxin-antitoxin system toxin DarT n=1 Tax=Luedemannella helvata TaxID=349315 RepID=A0ABP4W587_9ACTN
MHFTHVGHLTAIGQDGLLSDSAAQRTVSFKIEAGNVGIKEQRRQRPVPVPPGGVIADYVPFYFAARSPMMSAIANGKVPTYRGTCDELVYLVSSVERIIELGLPAVFTDRNAVLRVARFSNDPSDLDSMIDWNLMKARYWYNTDEEPDRRERRMAECLIHKQVPWAAFLGVAVKSETWARQARAALEAAGASSTIAVRPEWYF